MCLPIENPINFLTSSRIKLICSSGLEKNDKLKLIKNLRLKAESIRTTASVMVKNEKDFCSRIVFDNLECEYKNFISMLEGIEHACQSK